MVELASMVMELTAVPVRPSLLANIVNWNPSLATFIHNHHLVSNMNVNMEHVSCRKIPKIMFANAIQAIQVFSTNYLLSGF